MGLRDFLSFVGGGGGVRPAGRSRHAMVLFETQNPPVFRALNRILFYRESKNCPPQTFRNPHMITALF